jgi:hypothetical protein
MENNKDRKEKAAFSVPSSGYFEENTLFFRLCNAPPTFQRHMNKVLGCLIGTEVCCCIDDLIICSCTAREHGVGLEQVLQRLEDANLK